MPLHALSSFLFSCSARGAFDFIFIDIIYYMVTYLLNAFKTSVALCPPNPNEFVSA
jgi:hypothetical protein